jgi:hypothetical protein
MLLGPVEQVASLGDIYQELLIEMSMGHRNVFMIYYLEWN